MNDNHEALNALATESIDERWVQLDSLPTAGVLQAMNDAERSVPEAVSLILDRIAHAIDAIADRFADGGRIIYVGAGTSGRLGVLDAAECPPTFHTDPDRILGVIAGGRDAMFRSAEGVEDSESTGREEVGRLQVGPRDVVIGITASGRTPFVLGAVNAARQVGALTVGIACNAESRLGALVEHPLEVEVGPEVLAGSTRLKAGTAQKQILNMISTGTMVRMGKTYGNLMVDLEASNSKLRDRACRLIARITGADSDAVQQAASASDYTVPVAAAMLALGIPREEAERRLADAGGRLSTLLPHDTVITGR